MFGVFGVEKKQLLADGSTALPLAMNLVPPHAYQKILRCETKSMTNPLEWLQFAVLPHQNGLLSTSDIPFACVFHQIGSRVKALLLVGGPLPAHGFRLDEAVGEVLEEVVEESRVMNEPNVNEEIEMSPEFLMLLMCLVIQVMCRTKQESSQESVLDICSFGSDDMDVDYQPGNGWRRMDVTVDSGAANSVIDGDKHPNIPRE